MMTELHNFANERKTTKRIIVHLQQVKMKIIIKCANQFVEPSNILVFVYMTVMIIRLLIRTFFLRILFPKSFKIYEAVIHYHDK